MAKACPCGSDKVYTGCCGLYISAGELPPTPEALMRSRYTAFKNGNDEYIARTQKEAKTAPTNKTTHWLKLEVLSTSLAENNAQEAVVEFKAYYQYRGQKHVLHEISEFCLEKGQWLYLDGEIIHECCAGH
jgi:SEC-C motif domain protein